MMSANQFLIESQVRHQIFLLRRGGGMVKDLVPALQEILRSVAGQIATTPDAQLRQRAVIQEIEAFLLASVSEWSDEVLQESLELAAYEAGFQERLLIGVATVDFAAPAAVQLAQAVTFNPTIDDVNSGQSISIKQALDQFDSKKSAQMMQVIRDGIVGQKTNSQISKDLLDLAPGLGNQADALIRTSAISAANEAKTEFYRTNAEFLQGERFLATLDSRTTLICSGFDGKVYPVGSGPIPPLHWNCRSLRTPVLREDLQIPGFEGERPEVGADGPGTTSSRTTFNSFLKKQPASFQKEYFSKFPDGDERYKLFSQGSLSIGKFTDARGATLTLDELRALEPLAFERAGLD